VFDSVQAANSGFDGLNGWMRKAEAVWQAHSDSGAMTLTDRWNYHNELAAQCPVKTIRVVYAKAGTLPAACVLRDQRGIIDHMLYWMTPATETEAYYLTAIFNSETTRARIEQYQSRGQWGARHFDKVVFNLPIPHFDPQDRRYIALAEAAAEAEKIAVRVKLPEGIRFQNARAVVRTALAEAKVAPRIDVLATELLSR
jgi:hypothetical protein